MGETTLRVYHLAEFTEIEERIPYDKPFAQCALQEEAHSSGKELAVH
jgi:hypothetical protein